MASCCDEIVKTQEWIEGHEKRHAALDEVLDRVMNRVPLWVTFVMSSMSLIIGWLLDKVLR